MTVINDVCDYMETFAPSSLAEDWDNVGLLVGDRSIRVEKVMTCLTITRDTAIEAVEGGANLIVTHHPLPFRSFKRLTRDDLASRLLMHLIKHDVSIYSAHTAFDSATLGINQMLAERIGVRHTAPLVLANPDGDPAIGSGRMGTLANPIELPEFVKQLRSNFALDSIRGVPAHDRRVNRIGVACGSGGSFLNSAHRHDCDTFVTGESNFHGCLEAADCNMNLILLGHYTSEKFACDRLAELLEHHFTGVEVWGSKKESDPVSVL